MHNKTYAAEYVTSISIHFLGALVGFGIVESPLRCTMDNGGNEQGRSNGLSLICLTIGSPTTSLPASASRSSLALSSSPSRSPTPRPRLPPRSKSSCLHRHKGALFSSCVILGASQGGLNGKWVLLSLVSGFSASNQSRLVKIQTRLACQGTHYEDQASTTTGHTHTDNGRERRCDEEGQDVGLSLYLLSLRYGTALHGQKI